METTLVYAAFTLLLIVPAVRQLRRARRKEAAARQAAARAGLSSSGPRAQHPHIDVSHCIGCGACTDVCPEGEVLAVVGGKAAIVNPDKCIGHGLCAEACPVGAIEIVMASPSVSADLPHLSREQESSVPNLFVVGELGGLALIKNAVNQGRDCIDTIAARLGTGRHAPPGKDVHDVCIVGAGPGGISASLRAIERKLRYVTLEQDELGGTVAKYPRRKLVMTSPVEFPLHGKFRKLEVSKEELLKFWHGAVDSAGLRVNAGERVLDIQCDTSGIFSVTTPRGLYRARAVVLALGRRGTPRKLGVPGEELPKVMYSLLDAEAYRDARILIVGGGDSAVEAAMGLAHQTGNQVTLCYRGTAFTRIKGRNAERLKKVVTGGRLRVLYESRPIEITTDEVVLEVGGERRSLPNDYVWIFAGGIPPTELLEKIGVRTGVRDVTADGAREARAAAVR
jgi:thioredoxin reductase/ferredoxin